jgi:hypothetical protein
VNVFNISDFTGAFDLRLISQCLRR